MLVGIIALAAWAATAPLSPIATRPITLLETPAAPRRPPVPTVLGTLQNPIFIKVASSGDWTTTDKIAVGALVAGVLQFCALFWTVVIMVRNGRRQLRAYVSVSERYLYFETETKLTCVLTVKNFGQTPAFQVDESLDVWVDTYPEPQDIPPFDFDKESSPTYLAPTDEFHPYQDVDVSSSELDEIIAGKKAVWVSGAIRFIDAFGKQQLTPFRYFMSGPEFIGADRKMNIAPLGNSPRQN